MSWHAIAAARAHDARRRLPFAVQALVVGSVAREHLPALRRWPQWLVVHDDAVRLLAEGPARDEALARINEALHAEGLLRGWRDESFALLSLDGRQTLARMERAAARFWGTLTRGAHANGYVAGPDGRPAALWIAQRSPTKSTDPGLFDNLIGGGVPCGQTPLQTLVREGFEEAGLTPAALAGVRAGRVTRICRDIPEGLQREDLHAFDLALPAGLEPVNQDGEVAGFQLLPVAEALALAASPRMTVDASVVTLDFALRHQLIDEPAGADALFGGP